MPHDRILPVPIPERQTPPPSKPSDAGYDEIYSSGYDDGYNSKDEGDEENENDGPPPAAPKETIH